jgi:copper chaperone CopZ
MSKSTYTVVGEQKINCAGCEQRIDNALRRLNGIQEVKASAQNQRVEVAYDPAQTDAEKVRERLEKLGYQVQPEGATG